MWIVALFCATLGVLLSVRCKALALAPASFITLGFTIVYGLVAGWSVSGLVVGGIANLLILQTSYCVGRLVRQLFGKSVVRRTLMFRHTPP
jgi:hypothetical protein